MGQSKNSQSCFSENTKNHQDIALYIGAGEGLSWRDAEPDVVDMLGLNSSAGFTVGQGLSLSPASHELGQSQWDPILG